MANRIIAIGGEPATGKTTLMKNIIKDLMPLKTFKYKLVRGLYNSKKNIYIIGIYDESLFAGTDKLSMATQPDFIKLLSILKDSVIIFEGDRLFNQSLFDNVPCKILVLSADKNIIEQRHIKRNDTQTEQFKKAKNTKINNIVNNNDVVILNNNTKSDHTNNKKYILNLIYK